MGIVLTNGKIKIGAYNFPDRKKPVLGIAKDNAIVVYGTFQDERRADEFMNELAKMVHAKDGEA